MSAENGSLAHKVTDFLAEVPPAGLQAAWDKAHDGFVADLGTWCDCQG
jgi:hypothetical protein